MGEEARLRELLRSKRDGGELSPEDATWILSRTARGEIGDGPLAALLASIWFRGMSPEELAGWTRGMVESGEALPVRPGERPLVDKHSTGGVGDKVSLVLAPALAAMGARVPMISGRSLGHTGGTLDKLEAVPGVRTELGEAEIARVLEEVGCVICAQTESIAPADRVLYGLRDRVELVECLPLIASSIVSKKLAEGIGALVLDVKCGSGAFLGDREKARELARTMVSLGEAAGVRTSARLTWMGRPLGRAVGHSLEVDESRRALAGEGPADLLELTRALAVDLAVQSGLCADRDAAGSAFDRVIAGGDAAETFERMLRAQGATGDPLPRAAGVHELRAEADGVLGFADLRQVGYAVQDLGGGREAPGEPLDPGVGIEFVAEEGRALDAGDVLCLVHHASGRGLDRALERLRRAMSITDDAPEPQPLLLERIVKGD